MKRISEETKEAVGTIAIVLVALAILTGVYFLANQHGQQQQCLHTDPTVHVNE